MAVKCRLVEPASRAGFDHYEVSNFARPGRRWQLRAVGAPEVLPPETASVLKQAEEAQRFEARAPGYEPSEYVFTKPQGGAYHPQHLSKLLVKRSNASSRFHPRISRRSLLSRTPPLTQRSAAPDESHPGQRL